MTQETDITIDIQVEDATLGELIVWRGCKDKGKRDGLEAAQVDVPEDLHVALPLDQLTPVRRLEGDRRAAHGVDAALHEQIADERLGPARDDLGALLVDPKVHVSMGTEPQADDEHGRAAFRAGMAQRQLRIAQDNGIQTIGLVRS